MSNGAEEVSRMKDLCNIPLVLLPGHILSQILLSLMNYIVFFNLLWLD